MSADGSQPTEWLAIAFLVEASLALYSEWKRLFQDYIVQLLQRSNIATKVSRVAFVTYGTSDTLPSPILRKIYFTELRYIIQDIKDDRKRLGIGQTDSGGGKGMAALEGFASVLEMFDFFRTVSPKDLDCRMIHIAASPPDSSKHPQWNSSPSLDSLTWELLPAELKKRNIQLSGINIFPGLPRFPELYTQSATGNPTPPWFSVRAQDHIYLNGFASTQPQPKAKRVGEPLAVERTPEPKRAKVTPTQGPADSSPLNNPGQVPPSTSSSTISTASANATQSSIPQSTAQPASQSATQSTPQSSAPPATTNPQLLQILQRATVVMAKRKQLEEESRALVTRKQTAMSQGNTELASSCDVEINKYKEQFVKLSQVLNTLHQQARRMQPQSQVQAANTAGQDTSQVTHAGPSAPPAPRAVASPGLLPKEPQTPFSSTTATTPRPPPNIQSPTQNPQTTPSHSISTPSVPAPPPNPGVSSPTSNPTSHLASASMQKPGAAQIQKFLELSRNRPGPLGPTMTPSTSAQPVVNEGGVGHNNGTSVGLQLTQATAQASSPNQIQSILVWEGSLSFNGTGSDGQKKEVRTAVSASSSNAGNSHSDTWPSSLTLVPAPTPAVSIPEFQEWIRRTKPVLCTFKARTPEDETNYQMLVSVMSTKRIYATASWTLPNGVPKENVLIFPINNMGLCGAFFPLSGIPEMPKATSLSTPQIPPAILNWVAQLPPEQRNPAILQIRQKMAAGPEVATAFFRAILQRHLQQQQNAQNRAAMANQFGLNPVMAQLGAMGNSTNLMNMMNMNAMNATGMNTFAAMANPPAMLPNMNRPGTGGGSGASMNLNYDVLQSFMQRNNPDGNNPSGMGPG